MIAKSYKDLNEKQIKQVLPIVLQISGYGSDSEFALMAMSKLCKIFKIKFEEASKLEWLWATKITHKPFRFVRLGWTRYWLPDENFANTSGIELAMANIYYLRFATAPNIDAFAELLAILCRPRRWNWWFRRMSNDYDGDDRIAYNSLKASKEAIKFKNLPIGYSYAILQYFESMNSNFIKSYPEVFEADDSTKQLFANGEGWIATLEDVAKDSVHGTFDKVCGINAHTIWMYLKHNKIKTDEQIRQMERNQT